MAHSNLVQSVSRGLDILIEVSHADDGITLRDLSMRLNLKPPTVHNLVRTLKSKGFIQQCNGARYVLGPALFELVSQYQESRLMAEAEKTVRTLFTDMDQKATITFTALTGGEMQTTFRMSPDQPAIMQKPRRQYLNPYASATAVVLHTYASDDERRFFQERYPFQECAGRLAGEPEQYAELLKQARKQGYAFHPAPADPARFAVAAPVLGKTNELIAIIGLSFFGPDSGKIEEANKQAAIEKLLAAAENISKFWISLTGNRLKNGQKKFN